jgi:hypothetical protein
MVACTPVADPAAQAEIDADYQRDAMVGPTELTDGSRCRGRRTPAAAGQALGSARVASGVDERALITLFLPTLCSRVGRTCSP